MNVPTLLANHKMDPRLQARVQASVSGRRRGTSTSKASARLKFILRFSGLIGVVAAIGFGAMAKHKVNAEFAAAKAEILQNWSTAVSGVTDEEIGRCARIEASLMEMAGNYPGDIVAERLRTPAALTELLLAPALYVRAPLAAFSSPSEIRKAARDSGKDALLSCLLEPLADRSEKALLPKARAALLGSAQVEMPQVTRLFDLESGIPYLKQAWGEKLQRTQEMLELSRLSRELRHAPISRAKLAMKSRVLIGVMDEPNEGNGPTELDGEHRHMVRLVVSDIASGELLLRQRRVVDPSWITANRRSQYARELDGCRFALEVRDQVSGSIKP